ncbi:MAG TPA: glycosyltransferase [Flavobacteriaceae bacterium]|nr:glycosyltransferase [Flavobacteriaceae bacterium]
MEKPFVSILTITYNHELFIAQAIDSFLMQETDFDFEIVIGEDCSTDNTRKIIEEYQKTHPKKIRLLPSNKNLGIEANFYRTTQACNGKYIAICDGDDYWIDKNKLQLQVDFLEKNKDYGTVATLKKDFLQSESKFREKLDTINKEIKTLQFKYFLFNSYLTPVTVMFKNTLVKEYSKLYIENKDKLTFLDYSLWMYFSLKEKVGVLNKYTGVYRVLTESASHFRKNKSWVLDKKFYKDIIFYKENYPNIDKELMDKAIYSRAIKYYINACVAKDKKACLEFVQIFKNNKDYCRYALLKISLVITKFIGFAHFIEKINVRLNKKLLKNVDTYFS